jgi:hypothetical protein
MRHLSFIEPVRAIPGQLGLYRPALQIGGCRRLPSIQPTNHPSSRHLTGSLASVFKPQPGTHTGQFSPRSPADLRGC